MKNKARVFATLMSAALLALAFLPAVQAQGLDSGFESSEASPIPGFSRDTDSLVGDVASELYDFGDLWAKLTTALEMNFTEAEFGNLTGIIEKIVGRIQKFVEDVGWFAIIGGVIGLVLGIVLGLVPPALTTLVSLAIHVVALIVKWINRFIAVGAGLVALSAGLVAVIAVIKEIANVVDAIAGPLLVILISLPLIPPILLLLWRFIAFLVGIIIIVITALAALVIDC